MSHCQECGLKLWAIEKDICLCCKKKVPAEIEKCSCVPKIELDQSLEAAEKRHILRILEKNKWNKAQTSRDLKITLRTLYNKLMSYGLHFKE